MLALLNDFSGWYQAFPWPTRSLIWISLVLALAAIVYVAVQMIVVFMLRSLREAPIAEPVRTGRETYCRVCREYRITADTLCEHCLTPLLLFADALDMADHMGRTFPLPTVTPPLGTSQAKGLAFRDPTIFGDAARSDRAAHLRLLQQRRRTH